MVGRRGAGYSVHFSGRPMTSDTSEYLCRIIEALEPAGLIGECMLCPLATAGSYHHSVLVSFLLSWSSLLRRLQSLRVLKPWWLASRGQVASQTLDNVLLSATLPCLFWASDWLWQTKSSAVPKTSAHLISQRRRLLIAALFMLTGPETPSMREVLEMNSFWSWSHDWWPYAAYWVHWL